MKCGRARRERARRPSAVRLPSVSRPFRVRTFGVRPFLPSVRRPSAVRLPSVTSVRSDGPIPAEPLQGDRAERVHPVRARHRAAVRQLVLLLAGQEPCASVDALPPELRRQLAHGGEVAGPQLARQPLPDEPPKVEHGQLLRPLLPGVRASRHLVDERVGVVWHRLEPAQAAPHIRTCRATFSTGCTTTPVCDRCRSRPGLVTTKPARSSRRTRSRVFRTAQEG